MKKFLGLLFVSVLIFAGCSDEGVLKIENESSGDSWYELNSGSTQWLDPGEEDSHSWDLSTSIFGDEDKSVTVDFGGDFVFSNSVNKTIKPGSTANVDINSDAGIIRLENETFYNITEVYLAPSDDLYWGDNDLIGTIGYWEAAEWIVTPGDWDVKFYATDGYYYTLYNIGITTEFTFTITFESTREGTKTNSPIKEKDVNSINSITNDRIEQIKISDM
ncbi:MAG: hypothetical protein P9L97_09240 [Candidatus Tenebribacter davisii]|nr:hypothetical protein [Candidatus Tenebribacter davisii]